VVKTVSVASDGRGGLPSRWRETTSQAGARKPRRMRVPADRQPAEMRLIRRDTNAPGGGEPREFTKVKRRRRYRPLSRELGRRRWNASGASAKTRTAPRAGG